MSDAAIIGTGMTTFGKLLNRSLKDLGKEAVSGALTEAGIELSDVDMAFSANVAGAITTGQVSIVGQTILRDMGASGFPVFNIDNACAASSSALNLAVAAVRSGAARTVLVLGVEKLYADDRTATYRALNGAADLDRVTASGIDTGRESVFVTDIYPERIRRYAARHELDPVGLATISVKNRAHAALNPMAQYRTPLTVEDVLTSRTISEPITALMCAPISDGATAVVVTAASRIPAQARPVWVRGTSVGMGGSDGDVSALATVAAKAYAEAGINPGDVDVAELHDSTAFNELLAYEELGLADPGQGGRLVIDGHTSLGGSLPVNTSGGLESRGHPVAATGLAQVIELTLQLRGSAGERQVPDARTGLAENAGGFAKDDAAAIAVTILASEREG